MQPVRGWVLWGVAAAGLFAGGCGSSLATVSGTVTFNGQPVERGVINLTPADGKGAGVGGSIENGAYLLRDVVPGEKIVRLSAPVTLGTTTDDAGAQVQLVEDLMPAAWGRRSDERLMVAAPTTVKDFAIEGPDPRKR